MTADESATPPRPRQGNLGAALRRALIGYQLRLNRELAAAGLTDRRFPQARVLNLCSGPGETTISDLSRYLEITRQGASKIVSDLHERGYLSVTPSAADRREKILGLTPRGTSFLAARRAAVRAVEAQLRRDVGAEALAGLYHLLDTLAGPSLTMADRRIIARQAAAVADTLAGNPDDETGEDDPA